MNNQSETIEFILDKVYLDFVFLTFYGVKPFDTSEVLLLIRDNVSLVESVKIVWGEKY